MPYIFSRSTMSLVKERLLNHFLLHWFIGNTKTVRLQQKRCSNKTLLLFFLGLGTTYRTRYWNWINEMKCHNIDYYWLCSNYCLFDYLEETERTCQDEEVFKTRGADESVEPNRPEHATWTVRRELPTACFRLSKSPRTSCTSMRILPGQKTCKFIYSVIKHILNCHLTAKILMWRFNHIKSDLCFCAFWIFSIFFVVDF